jgi:hypothetical protein
VNTANVWSQNGDVKFFVSDDPKSPIKVDFKSGPGHFSYLGTDSLSYSPSMNFDPTDERFPRGDDFSRVIKHEFGHALGLEHEQSHPEASIPWNKPKVYIYYKEAMGWDQDKVDRNVFAVASSSRVNFTKYDPRSVMHYPISPYLLLDSSRAVDYNPDLSAEDRKGIKEWYPPVPIPRLPVIFASGSGLHQTDGNWDFALAPNGDLICIAKKGGSNTTEVHTLSASSGYKNFSLQTATAIYQTNENFKFLYGGPRNDLFAIKKAGTGTSTTEVHAVSVP